VASGPPLIQAGIRAMVARTVDDGGSLEAGQRLGRKVSHFLCLSPAAEDFLEGSTGHWVRSLLL